MIEFWSVIGIFIAIVIGATFFGVRDEIKKENRIKELENRLAVLEQWAGDGPELSAIMDGDFDKEEL